MPRPARWKRHIGFDGRHPVVQVRRCFFCPSDGCEPSDFQSRFRRECGRLGDEREPATGQDNFQWQAAQQASSDGTPFVGFFERWIPEVDGNQPDWSITQELRDIPDGKYRLTAYILTNVMANAETGVTSPKGSYLTARSIGEEVRREADIPSPDGNGYAVLIP